MASSSTAATTSTSTSTSTTPTTTTTTTTPPPPLSGVDPADEAGGEIVYASDGLAPSRIAKPPDVVQSTTSTDKDASEVVLDSDSYLTPQLAFEVFQGKVYTNNSNTNTNTNNSNGGGGGSSRNAYSNSLSSTTSTDESPIQRLARLQQEVQEVEAQLQLQAATMMVTSTNKGGRDFDEALVGLASSLSTQLLTLSTTHSRVLEQDDLTRLIRAQMASLSTTTTTTKEDGSSSSSEKKPSSSPSTTTSSDSTGVVYELYGRATNPTSTLEDRLVTLEKAVGASSLAVTSSTTTTTASKAQSNSSGNTTTPTTTNGGPVVSHHHNNSNHTNKTLLHRLEELEHLVQTVDDKTMEQTTMKAKVIRADLEAASKARNKLSATYKKEDSKMIQQLHSQLVELEGLSGYLPSLVDRLQQLAGLHVQAASVQSRLGACETSTTQLAQTVTQLETSVGQLTGQLADNLGTLQGNLDLLDERLTQL